MGSFFGRAVKQFFFNSYQRYKGQMEVLFSILTLHLVYSSLNRGRNKNDGAKLLSITKS